MGYVRGFVHGAVVGTVVGLCVAPQTGDRTRAQVAVVIARVRDAAARAQGAMRGLGPIAKTAVHSAGGAVETVRGQVTRRGGRHEHNGEAPLTVESLRSE